MKTTLFKAFSIGLALVMTGHLGYTQPAAEKVTNAVEAMHAMLLVNNAGDPSLFVKRGEVQDETGAPTGRQVELLSYNGHGYGDGFTSNMLYDLVIEYKGNNITSGKQVKSDCEPYAIWLMWSGDRVSEVRQFTQSYKVSYDAGGRITGLNKGGWAKKNKKEWVRDRATISYDGEGRPVQVSRIKEIGTGKAYNDVTPKVSYTEYKKEISYTADGKIKVTVTSYAPKNKTKDDDVVRSERGALFEEKPDGMLVTSYSGDAVNGRKTVETQEDGKVEVTYENLPGGGITVNTFTVDERGWLTYSLETGTNRDGSARTMIDRTYTYTPKEEAHGEGACAYRSEVLMRHLDAEGSPVKEIKGSQYREKLSDGSWSPWKYAQY
ncbi:hypothetical protein AB9P05_10505 [Roseivirga sp. BDSF3-8]|uniref:hypothetical protein n=1 Tax=Roseivirga sp. BDSF3-8 TaxID=3241598 RepID=UPI0035321834